MVLPPIVQRLQAGFLANVRTNMATTPYVSEEYRQVMSALVGEGAPIRLIADVTSMGLVEGWAKRLNAQESGNQVSFSWQGPARLFEPFLREPVGNQAPSFSRKSFLDIMRHHPLVSRRVLEIRFPYMLNVDFTIWMQESWRLIHERMNGYGLYFYFKDEKNVVTIRHPTLTLFELGLRYCFGADAVRLCETSGEVAVDEMKELDEIGYHPHGLPFEKLPIHFASKYDPAAYGSHDKAHAVLRSTRVLL